MNRPRQPYVLSENCDLSIIFHPLKATRRIKYTCFNVSQNFLILGATSGSLYVFKREPCSFLQLLPNKEGSVLDVCISPSEKLFAFATTKGTVCILERNEGLGARVIQISREHLNAEVTAMQWNNHSNELYVADNLGRVSVINIIIFMAKNMFNMPVFMLMHLDSRIVQLDWQGNLLLVSTLSRCYLCNTYKEEYRQIGQKLRDGEFGACFWNSGDEAVLSSNMERKKTGVFSSLAQDEKLKGYESYANVKIYCARPGSRLWEVNVDGLIVKNTHQFKEALAVQPGKIVNTSSSQNTCSDSNGFLGNIQQSFNFAKLYVLDKKFLFTFKKDGIYIFDPVEANVVLWNNEFVNTVDCKVFNDMIYLRLATGALHAIMFSSLEKLLFRLYLQNKYEICGELCASHLDYLSSQVGVSHRLMILSDLGDRLRNSQGEVAEKIFPFLRKLAEYKGQQKSLQLKSGIFLVHNSHLPYYLDQVLNSQPSLMNGTKLKEAHRKNSRSQTPSPQIKEKKLFEMRKVRSCSSIQDISNQNGIEFKNSNITTDNLRANYSKPKTSSEFPLPFSNFTNPQTMQALKLLGHSVSDRFNNSTRTLKEKWLTLEDKMKHLGQLNQDFPQEPFDIKLPNSVHIETTLPNSTSGEHDNNLVFFNGAQKQSNRPSINITHIANLCLEISSSKCMPNDGSYDDLVFELFSSLSTMHKQFVSSNPKDDTIRSDVPFHPGKRPFPFKHYFTSTTLSVIQETLHESLKSKLLIHWIEKLSINFDLLMFHIPDNLIATHSLNNLQTDCLLSMVLTVLAELIDSNSIVECIKQSQVPCYYLTLSAVLNLYDDGALSNPRNDRPDSEKWPLLFLFNAMFCVLRMGQVETCLKMGESVELKDVFYLILRLHAHLSESGIESERALSECYFQLLTYVNNVDKKTVISALKNKELSSFLLTAFHYTNSNIVDTCECGYPLPNLPPPTPQFPLLAEFISFHLHSEDNRKLFKLATEIPGMWYYILKNQTIKLNVQDLPLLIHVGDISEVNNRLEFFDFNLWENMLELFVQYRSGLCLNCYQHHSSRKEIDLQGITWIELAMAMLKSLGPKPTVDLLFKFSSRIPTGDLSIRFYHACILMSMVDNYASGLGENVINMLESEPTSECSSHKEINFANMQMGISKPDSPYRSSNSESIPTSNSSSRTPTAGEMFKKKPTSKRRQPEPPARAPGRMFSSLSSYSSFLASLPSASAVDHNSSVSLLSDTCRCCAKLLTLHGCIVDNSITAYRCGHAYHTSCVTWDNQTECVLCVDYDE